MHATKIRFEQEDWNFMESYKEATGISVQRFVTDAIKEHIAKAKAEQAIKDLSLTKK